MIEVENLYKSFGTNKVIDGMNLKMDDGETLVILGRSGVGKSVLLKHIIGLSKPDQGRVTINGCNITSLNGAPLYKAIKNMGMLFQGGALFDSMTIEENTAFYLMQHGDPKTGKRYTPQEIKSLVSHALNTVGLDGEQEKMPADLSGGMKKRAALARLIVYRPSYILYDEPTTGLDPITSMQINELIVKTQKQLNATSIVVTHDPVSALYVGDQLALVENGKIAYLEKPEAFMEIDHPTIRALRDIVTQNPRSIRGRNNE